MYTFILPRTAFAWKHGPVDPRHIDDTIPYEDEASHDVGLFLPFNADVYSDACATPLPTLTVEELSVLEHGVETRQDNTAVGARGDREERFMRGPLDVPGGVAVMEESVGCGVADVITLV